MKYLIIGDYIYGRGSAQKETCRIEDLAFLVEDMVGNPITLWEYARLDPIIIAGKNDLLDGYHRLAGLVAAGETGEIDVIVIYDEDLAGRLAEPGSIQDEALDELREIL